MCKNIMEFNTRLGQLPNRMKQEKDWESLELEQLSDLVEFFGSETQYF